MDRLSLEVRLNIFQRLNSFELSGAVLASRQWHDDIRRVFFNNIYLDETRTLDQLFRMIRASDDIRNQIRTLSIHGYSQIITERRILFFNFPRIRQIYLHPIASMSLYNQDIDGNDDPEFVAWRNQIIEMQQHVWTTHNNNLFSSGVFHGLRRLVLNFGRSERLDRRIDILMRNAPNLSSLYLMNTMISQDNLRSLRNGLLNLEVLSLRNIHLLDINTPEVNPDVVMAANNVTTLFVSYRRASGDAVVNWLRFITENYAQLQYFSFLSQLNQRPNQAQEHRIVNEGWRPLLNAHRDVLLGVEASCSNVLTELLDAVVEANIERLHPIELRQINTYLSPLIPDFVPHPQLSMIRKLTVNVTESNMLSPILGELESLEELQVSSNPGTINRVIDLRSFLNRCPLSLQTLEVYGFIINCDLRADLPSPRLPVHPNFPNLLKLTLRYYYIEPHAFEFINEDLSQNLITLELITDPRVLLNRPIDLPLNDLNIQLNNLNLITLNISNMEVNPLVVTTILDNQERVVQLYAQDPRGFRYDDFNNAEQPSYTQELANDNAHGANSLHLICNSVRGIIANNKIVVF